MYPQFPNQSFPYPYIPQYPIYPYPPMMTPKPSLLQSMKYSLNQMSMSSTLRTAQKTLYTVNQLIPIVNQLRPVVHNATTAFRVVKAVKEFNFDDEIDENVHDNPEIFENMYPEEKA